MVRQKFKIGDRVRVVNGWARSTCANVQNGEMGTVTGCDGPNCDLNMDNDPDGIPWPWSVPQRGLSLVTEGGKKK